MISVAMQPTLSSAVSFKGLRVPRPSWHRDPGANHMVSFPPQFLSNVYKCRLRGNGHRFGADNVNERLSRSQIETNRVEMDRRYGSLGGDACFNNCAVVFVCVSFFYTNTVIPGDSGNGPWVGLPNDTQIFIMHCKHHFFFRKHICATLGKVWC